MVELFRDECWTLDEIGTVFGITRERARQIIRKAGYTGQRGGAPEREAMIRATVGDATSLRDAAQRCRLPRSQLRSWLEERGLYEAARSGWRTRRKKRYLAAARPRLIAELRALATRLGHVPGTGDIVADANTSSRYLFYRVFGSLQAAQEAAGFVPRVVGPFGWTTPPPASIPPVDELPDGMDPTSIYAAQRRSAEDIAQIKAARARARARLRIARHPPAADTR